MENSIIFFILLAVFGTIWYVIKTPSKVEEVKDSNINRNIQAINKMGYIPEEDDELDGFEQAERPAIHFKPYEDLRERYERLKKAGYYNNHVKSIID